MPTWFRHCVIARGRLKWLSLYVFNSMHQTSRMYRVRQHKMSQHENRYISEMREYFCTKCCIQLCTNVLLKLYLLDVRQIDRSTTFKNEFRNSTNGMARQALPRLHRQRTPDRQTAQIWTTCGKPCWMSSRSWKLKPKSQNVTDPKRRYTLSGTICLMKTIRKSFFWAFANHSWHVSMLKADIQTFN